MFYNLLPSGGRRRIRSEHQTLTDIYIRFSFPIHFFFSFFYSLSFAILKSSGHIFFIFLVSDFLFHLLF